MSEIFQGFINNNVLMTSVLAWFVAQVMKVVIVCIISKRLDFSRIIGSGGMPSSHSSFAVSLAVSIGMECGFESPMFAVCFCFALVVMYDAAGVRRSAGQQAKILNQLVDNWGRGNFVDTDKRLKELLGHTPTEVFAGALLGIIIAVLRH